jgi:rRNA maturation endonuclease Nob1
MSENDVLEWVWTCLGCGRQFRTAAEVEDALDHPDGCPACGSKNIDLVPIPQANPNRDDDR